MPKPQSWRLDSESDLGAGALWLLSLSLAVLVSVVVALMALPAIHAQQTFSHGAVVALEGTPHLWIADAQGVLHWGGDTRALAGKHVNWNDRTEVTLAQLRRLAVGDPWLSAGLLKDGDPIYLVKWESDWERPRLLHIQSIADVELFGIDGSNYGRFVLDRATWEARYGMSAASLQRSALPAAVTTAIATPTPIRRPTIDPRLQAALNMIEETLPGHVYGEYSAVTTKGTTFTFGHIEHLAQYTISTNTITVDESMRHQPLEVIAYLLVHELNHAKKPWTKYGEKPKGAEGLASDYCFTNEYFAEQSAAWWWSKRYGEAGHPDTDNPRVRHANYAAWLFRQDYRDIENGKEANRFKDFMRDILKDYCKLGQTAAPAPTPTPVPTPQPAPVPISGTATIEEVERFLSLPAWHYEAMVRNALAQKYNLNPNGYAMATLMRVFPKYIDVLPLVYLMYTWSEYPYGTFPDIQAFVSAYVGNAREYVRLAYKWLESDPCTWPEPVQQEMVTAEQKSPGLMKAMLVNSVEAPHLAEIVVPGTIDEARQAYLDDPEAYLNQFRCTA
ncbi:MAG: hypothetical protein OXE05_03975 [Chloroflexi bacterium]|nr:hypothetical protein [Chloroflexota bacterium]